MRPDCFKIFITSAFKRVYRRPLHFCFWRRRNHFCHYFNQCLFNLNVLHTVFAIYVFGTKNVWKNAFAIYTIDYVDQNVTKTKKVSPHITVRRSTIGDKGIKTVAIIEKGFKAQQWKWPTCIMHLNRKADPIIRSLKWVPKWMLSFKPDALQRLN